MRAIRERLFERTFNWRVAYLHFLYGRICGTKHLVRLSDETDYFTRKAWRHWLLWNLFLAGKGY